MNDQLAKRRSTVNCILFSSLAAVLLVVLNLPSEHVRVLVAREGRIADAGVSGMLGSTKSIERTGWPLNYRVRLLSQVSSEKPSLLYESKRNLIINVMIGLVVMALLWLYTRRRYRQISLSKNPKSARLRFDATTAGLALLIPALIYLLSSMTATQHQRIAVRTSHFGHCSLSAELPRWLATRIPRPLFRAFLRVRDVEVYRPSTAMLNELLSLSTLRGIRIIASTLEEDDFARMSKATELTEVVLESCSMSTEAVKLLSDHSQLRELALRRCRLEKTDLENLNRLPNLERVDFSRSSFAFSDFKQTGWASSVRTLRLPTPGTSERVRLELSNWSVLEEVALERSRRRPSDATIELHLEACPVLKSIYLPAPQQYSLHAIGLPALENLFESLDIPFGSPRDTSNFLLPRWEVVNLKHLPKLTRIECNAEDLEELRLSGMTRLREVIIGRSVFSPVYLKESTPERYEHSVKWIDEICRLPDIRSLTLDRLRLGSGELSRIAEIQSLEKLKLTNSGLSSAELKPIAKIESLKELDLHQSVVDRPQLRRFLELPKLARLTADLSGLDQLHLSNHQRIKEISSLPFRKLSSLRLRNLPRLSSGVVIQDQIEHLHITNVPNLVDLTVECPWPEDARVEEVEGLMRFIAGGSNVDDRLVETLLDCADLDQLVLAYASLSRKGLRRIGKMTALTALEVPGSELDDDVTRAWRGLGRLRRICVDDTEIGDETVAWFGSLASLRSLSLNRVELSTAAWEKISSFSQLSELSIIGSSMPYRLLNRLVRHGGLEVLDVSGFELSDELVEAIVHARYLHTVVMMDCDIEIGQLRQILTEQRHMMLIANFDDELLGKLSPDERDRINTSHKESYRRRTSRQSHRVMILSKDPDPDGEGESIVNRPFNVDQFREPVATSDLAASP
ncbi:uncharacterized protein YjbI with pentapeptide repeats [Rhodopirellula rubra]|uniref:Uncharacterized protein YjbI with pentapeptide repeats n=1 Tax=Aporhodopirellula rubra TaxID=980271 RepID=A0A7W5H7L3_9BACT|nr:protein kinase [Aporhodopirellula rubra]MBB3208539.1 uncharacterized protein YjbI with pentapeptide repeats [Aporhodopirellula rubra]